MIPNIWIFCLEPLPQRYTEQWHTDIPKSISQLALDRGISVNVRQIDGTQRNTSLTPGAFLNFSDTNYWKSSQLLNFLEMFDAGETTPNDVFLFTDAWNPVITQIKYINDLLDFKWRLHSIFHAGAYDPTDILGMKMSKPWPWHQERAWYYATDKNWYATAFHRDMFLKNLNIPVEDHNRAMVSGQPHGSIVRAMESMVEFDKSGVIWPHRYNSDKQPEIAEDLRGRMDDSWCITQKLNLSKSEYYNKLAQSTVMFSCSLHENLGISIMEGVLAGVIPVLPNRCSYQEMYLPEFLYPSEWTSSWDNYLAHRDELQQFIQVRLNNPHSFAKSMKVQRLLLKNGYLTADKMFNSMLEDIAISQVNQ